jgi:hypothetical protein
MMPGARIEMIEHEIGGFSALRTFRKSHEFVDVEKIRRASLIIWVTSTMLRLVRE